MNPYNLPNHYEVKELEEGYTFKTINNEVYYVYFLPTGELFTDSGFDVYSFNIERVEKSKYLNRQSDDLSGTIAYILDLFFKKQKNAIITQCETDDGNQAARARLFERWYNRYNQGLVGKLSEIVQIDESVSTLFSIYYNRKAPNFNLLLEDFNDYIGYNSYE